VTPETRTVDIVYHNWKDETAIRRVTPKVFYWGSTTYHPENQWLMLAFDEDKKQDRVFAMRDITSWDVKE